MTESDYQDIKLENHKLLDKNLNHQLLDNSRKLARHTSMQPDANLDTDNKILKKYQNQYSFDQNRFLASQAFDLTDTDFKQNVHSDIEPANDKPNLHVTQKNQISFDHDTQLSRQTSQATETDFNEINQQSKNSEKSKLLDTNHNKNSLGIERNLPRQRSIIIESQFKEIMQKHRISLFFAKKLKNLNSFKIVFILDDSGSMNTILEESPLNKGSFKATRWDELQEFIRISIEIASVVNPEGCDVYFLNRRMVKNVKKPEEIASSFKKKPSELFC